MNVLENLWDSSVVVLLFMMKNIFEKLIFKLLDIICGSTETLN